MGDDVDEIDVRGGNVGRSDVDENDVGGCVKGVAVGLPRLGSTIVSRVGATSGDSEAELGDSVSDGRGAGVESLPL